MNATELRIGNWVNRRYWNPNPQTPCYELEPCIIERVATIYVNIILKDKKIISKLYVENNIEPITITPEILEKAGFIKSDDEFGGWLSKEVIREQPHTFLQLRIREDKNGFYYDNTFITRIKYFHQLQNLYFAISGEELTYTP